jgi:hypothetical protein
MVKVLEVAHSLGWRLSWPDEMKYAPSNFDTLLPYSTPYNNLLNQKGKE